jgi:hypothetical protein
MHRVAIFITGKLFQSRERVKPIPHARVATRMEISHFAIAESEIPALRCPCICTMPL